MPAPRLINAWQVPGTRTVFWVQNMRNNCVIKLVQEGGQLTLPLSPDEARIGLGIFNGNTGTRGYVTFIEGHNLWEGGPAPSECQASHMWVVPPGTPRIMDAMMSSNSQAGRPFVVTPIGGGYTHRRGHCCQRSHWTHPGVRKVAGDRGAASVQFSL